jgi:hypothetical protein
VFQLVVARNLQGVKKMDVIGWEIGTVGWVMENKFKVATSAGQVTASVFWHSEGISIGEFFSRRATIISERIVQTLNKLEQRIRRIRPNRKTNQVLILHGVQI